VAPLERTTCQTKTIGSCGYEDGYACDRHRGPAALQHAATPPLPCFAHRNAQTDTCRMKQCSCTDEADAIAYRGDACRHFGPVGVTMKDGEKSDNGRGDGRPQLS